VRPLNFTVRWRMHVPIPIAVALLGATGALAAYRPLRAIKAGHFVSRRSRVVIYRTRNPLDFWLTTTFELAMAALFVAAGAYVFFRGASGR
jgi:hypothetical protein